MNEKVMAPKFWRYAFLFCLFTVVSMIAVFIITLEMINGDWQKIEAVVESTSIESSNPGSGPEWSLMVSASYEVDGKTYNKDKLDVFHDVDWNVTKAEQQSWPNSKTFTLYYDTKNPEQSSRASDGDRQAIAVLASILTPMIITILAFIFFVMRRRREGNTK